MMNHQPCQTSNAFELFKFVLVMFKCPKDITQSVVNWDKTLCSTYKSYGSDMCLYPCVCVCVGTTRVFVCKGNGWQWKMWPILILIANEKKRPQYLWVLFRWTVENGLSMKAYSLSQLKSALTWLQPFEVRLVVILERSSLASNNGNRTGKKKWFSRAKGNASLSLSHFFLWIRLMLFFDRFYCVSFFSTWN